MSRKEQAQQSRAKLVDVALELFVEQGYANTSVAQIIDQAGMAKGALYHHFPDGKRSLFAAVVDVVDHDLHVAFDRVLETYDSPTEQIIQGIAALLELASQKNFGKIVLIEAASAMPGAWEGGSEYELLRANLILAMEAGELRPAPPDALAVALFGAARKSADHVAASSTPKKAASEALAALKQLIDGLRVTG